MKYTAIINFKIDIKAENQEQAEHIASKAIPTHFGFMDGKGGSGTFLRGLSPVVYEADADYKDIKLVRWNEIT